MKLQFQSTYMAINYKIRKQFEFPFNNEGWNDNWSLSYRLDIALNPVNRTRTFVRWSPLK